MSELPDELFDGHAVFCALTDGARKRTSTENVSDVLDALAKVMKARRSPPPPAKRSFSEEEREAMRLVSFLASNSQHCGWNTLVDNDRARTAISVLSALANGDAK